MKKVEVACDRGCISIGNEDFVTYIPNGSGDGFFTVYISENEPDLTKYETVSLVSGKCHLFEYDCLTPTDRARHIQEGRTIPLDGYYLILKPRKWEDFSMYILKK